MDQSPVSPPPSRPPEGTAVRRWVARFGVAGLIFFTVKGLLWLIIPALAAAGIFRSAS